MPDPDQLVTTRAVLTRKAGDLTANAILELMRGTHYALRDTQTGGAYWKVTVDAHGMNSRHEGVRASFEGAQGLASAMLAKAMVVLAAKRALEEAEQALREVAESKPEPAVVAVASHLPAGEDDGEPPF